MKAKIMATVLFGMLILTAVLLVGCPTQQKPQGEEGKEETPAETMPTGESEPAQPEEGKTTKITLYFSDSQAEYLKPEVREITQTKSVAKAAVLELIKGPETKGLHSTIPPGTKLRSVSIKNKVAYVDFSQEFVRNHPGGSAGETMTIYSVVNTLTEFSSIQKVKFLVQGHSIETLAGHADLTEPLPRNEAIIKK